CCVRDLGRLAEDLVAGVRQFARWGEEFADHADRSDRILEAMMAWLVEGDLPRLGWLTSPNKGIF
ncbi:MAG: hypothetical protein R3335_15495, partial [Anaerolineales bacterium]|nr:hypothetical protein [Anaerolineales bacterium]